VAALERDAVGARDAALLIDQELERQAVLGCKRAVRLQGIQRDAEDRGT